MENSIRKAVWADQKWVAKLFDKNKDTLGVVGGGLAFYRWYNDGNDRARWIVIPEIAFAHYLIRKDGFKVLYEIAVDSEHRRKGLATALIKKIGYPIELKTDKDNVASNAFYLRLGFWLMGAKRTAGGKIVNIYQKWAD